MRLNRLAAQWTGILVLLLILAVINHYRPDLTGFDINPEPSQGPETHGGAYRAIDGDSFRAGGTEVRLHGIDAPELRQSCADVNGRDYACGRQARDALSKLIRGRTISCRVIEADRYGREVSVCRSGDIDINREMVRLGWALAYRRHSLAYVGAENEAKQAKRGLWQGRFERPGDYRGRNRPVEGSMSELD